MESAEFIRKWNSIFNEHNTTLLIGENTDTGFMKLFRERATYSEGVEILYNSIKCGFDINCPYFYINTEEKKEIMYNLYNLEDIYEINANLIKSKMEEE